MFCECGCKKLVRGGNRFVCGHNSRARSDETRNKISKSRKGKAIGNQNAKGSKRTAEWRSRKSEALKGNQHTKGYKHTEETKCKMSAVALGRKIPEETKQKMSLAAIGRRNSEESKQKNRESHLGNRYTEERKKSMSETAKHMWANPIWHKEQQIRMTRGARLQRPNKPETKLLCLLEAIQPSDWKYVGDGSLVIGRKNPDFVNSKEKLLIELFGDYWHRGQDPQDRIDVFTPHGYQTLVVWEKELKDQSKLTKRITNFAA